MKNLPGIIFILALIGLGVWLWTVFCPSPEKVITKNLQKLAHSASVRPGEGTIPRMAGAQAAGSLCDSNVEVNIDIPGRHRHGTLSRDDIVQGLMALKMNSAFKVEFPDITISIGADKVTAEADVTLEAHISGEAEMIIQQVRVTLRKIDGKWLITKVQTVRTFSGQWEILYERRACVI